jgi:hypothetical protein
MRSSGRESLSSINRWITLNLSERRAPMCRELLAGVKDHRKLHQGSSAISSPGPVDALFSGTNGKCCSPNDGCHDEAPLTGSRSNVLYSQGCDARRSQRSYCRHTPQRSDTHVVITACLSFQPSPGFQRLAVLGPEMEAAACRIKRSVCTLPNSNSHGRSRSLEF